MCCGIYLNLNNNRLSEKTCWFFTVSITEKISKLSILKMKERIQQLIKKTQLMFSLKTISPFFFFEEEDYVLE